MSHTPDPRLNEIQARLDAATPGPWAVDELGDVETVPEFDLHRFDIMPDTIARTELRKEDGAFIAAAPADVRYLLAELRKAHEALERVEEWIDRLEKNQSSDIAKRQNAQFDLGYSSGRRAAGSILRAAVAAAKGGEA